MIPTYPVTISADNYVKSDMPSLTFEIDWQNKRLTSKKIDGIQAVGQAVQVITSVQQNEWRGYEPTFGIDARFIIGRPLDFAIANTERIIKEGIYKDNRVDTLKDMKIEVKKDDNNKNILIVNFDTVSYGESIPSEVKIAI